MREKGFTAHCPQAAGGRRVDRVHQQGGRWLDFYEGQVGWFMGTNIPGKTRAVLLNPLPAPAYRAKCAEAAAKGYEGFAVAINRLAHVQYLCSFCEDHAEAAHHPALDQCGAAAAVEAAAGAGSGVPRRA